MPTSFVKIPFSRNSSVRLDLGPINDLHQGVLATL